MRLTFPHLMFGVRLISISGVSAICASITIGLGLIGGHYVWPGVIFFTLMAFACFVAGLVCTFLLYIPVGHRLDVEAEQLELLPCPMCGGRHMSAQWSSDSQGPSGWWIMCRTCFTSGDLGKWNTRPNWLMRLFPLKYAVIAKGKGSRKSTASR